MKREKSKAWITAAVLLPAGLLLFAVLAITAWGAAQGQASQGPSADESRPSAVENRPSAVDNGPSILVAAAAFVDDGGPTQDYAYTDLGGYTFAFSETRICLQAPVYLPDGATVTEFGGYVLDDTSGANIDPIELRRVKYLASTPGNSLSDLMAEASTTTPGAVNEIRWVSDQTVENDLVDTATFAYYAFVCIDGGQQESLRLYAVEAYYTP